MQPLRIRLRLTGILAAMALAAPCLPAADQPTKSAEQSPATPHFFDFKGFEVRKILPAPPAQGSLTARADLDAVIQAQTWRTPEQEAWARLVDKFDLFAIFGTDDLLGSQFRKEALPVYSHLGKDLGDDLEPLVEASKAVFARPRPFLVDSSVEPCVKRPTNGSYPSGHSFGIWITAFVLAEIHPEMRPGIMARAHKAAWGRVLAGVHFPTDLEAGRVMAEAVFADLMKISAFHAAIEKCRAEARSVAMPKAA